MTNTTHLNLVNVSVRMFQVHRDMIEEAAALVPNRTISDYMRDTLAMQAALDLNRELPRVPEINRGRNGSMIAQAAAKLGMSREEFEQQAIRAMAAQTLEANALDNRPISERPPAPERRDSEVRQLAQRPGSYSQQPAKRITGADRKAR
jgi:uncharacterized protein (DUF1778 family)